MRNLKKILALVLALVMALSVMSVAGAMKLDDYADSASVSSDYQTAVDVATQLGILNGMTATEYQPQGNLTRAQLATIIYRITTGDVTGRYVSNFVDGAAARFDDVTARHWAAGYIGYCADAGYLEGWDGKYWPEQAMTGYQALAALLRAIGYNEPGEFSGEAWTVRVAQLATQSGVSTGVIANLNNAITREQTAQFIYNALWTEQVTYTPMFAYYNNNKAPLVQEVFNVGTVKGGVTGNSDAWGRPSTVWYAPDNRTKIIEMVDDPVATYTAAVDECDIAYDLGLRGNTRIESGWIDGEPADVDDNDTVEPLATTKMVGAQGRITEVYDMGRDGVRIVEINTYLGVVTGVSDAWTDKNEHPVGARITVGVWEDATKDNNRAWSFSVNTEGYSVGDYVLVHVNRPGAYATNGASVSASDIRLATITAGGTLNGFTANTHIVGGTTYAEADKFELRYREAGNWAVILDDWGNLIGLGQVATNYLVIEAISWIDNGIRGGYALADVVLSDGTKVANVNIATITGEDGIPNTASNTDVAGNRNAGTVSDGYTANTQYYNHIWIYSMNADGSYNIQTAPDSLATAAGDADIRHDDANSLIFDLGQTSTVTFAQGEATIADDVNDVVATNATVYLVKAANSYSYTVYVGKNNMPSGTADSVCVLNNAAGYASLVVVNNFVPAANNMLVFVSDWQWDVWGGTLLGQGYFVYPAGSAEPITVYDPNGWMTRIGRGAYVGTGLYEISVDGTNTLTYAYPVVLGLSETASTPGTYTHTATNVIHERLRIEDTLDNGSISTENYSGLIVDWADLGYDSTAGVADIDFNVLEETTVLQVSKAGLNGDAVLSLSSASRIPDEAVVIVGYTTRTVNSRTIYNAQYVYWYVNDSTTSAATYDFVLRDATMDIDEGAELVIGLTRNGTRITPAAAQLTVHDVTLRDLSGYEIYSTSPDVTIDPVTGNIIVKVRNTLTAGQKYMGIVDISYTYVENGRARTYREEVTSAYIEAQNQVGGSGADADYVVTVSEGDLEVTSILVYNDASTATNDLLEQIAEELTSMGYKVTKVEYNDTDSVWEFTTTYGPYNIENVFTWDPSGSAAVPAASVLLSNVPGQAGDATKMIDIETDATKDSANLAILKALPKGVYVFDYTVQQAAGVQDGAGTWHYSDPESIFYLNYTSAGNTIQYTIKDSYGNDVWDTNYGWTTTAMQWTSSAGAKYRPFSVGAWGYIGGASAGDGTYTVTFTDTVTNADIADVKITITGGKIVSIVNN